MRDEAPIEESVKTIQAYRFALDLTAGQQRVVLAHAGAARVAYNWALARVEAVLGQRTAEPSYGVPDQQLTPSLSWSLAGLRKAWNVAKREVAPWWAEVSKEAFNTGLDALARGSTNWADSRAGKRAGRPVGFPRFKSRRRATPSVRFTTGAIRVESDRKIVVEDLNVSGMLRNRRLARRIADAGFAEIRRQLTYKTRWNGGRLVTAGRFYASSKTCSGCGAVKAKLALSERVYDCAACALVLDRDLNAARNLAALAARTTTAGSGPVAARGADQKTRACGQWP